MAAAPAPNEERAFAHTHARSHLRRSHSNAGCWIRSTRAGVVCPTDGLRSSESAPTATSGTSGRQSRTQAPGAAGTTSPKTSGARPSHRWKRVTLEEGSPGTTSHDGLRRLTGSAGARLVRRPWSSVLAGGGGRGPIIVVVEAYVDRLFRAAEHHLCPAFVEAGEKRERPVEVVGLRERRWWAQLKDLAAEERKQGEAEDRSEEGPEASEDERVRAPDLVVEPELLVGHSRQNADDGADNHRPQGR